jgi:hypothetical protein
VIAIMIYTLYTQACIIYKFSRDSIKCSKCTYKGVSYNRNFSKADFNKLLEEKACLEAIRTCVIKEIVSLNRCIKALYKA